MQLDTRPKKRKFSLSSPDFLFLVFNQNFPPTMPLTICVILSFQFSLRGTGEWRIGQHSWNISVANEVRGGTKGTVVIASGMPIMWNLSLLMKKIVKNFIVIL